MVLWVEGIEQGKYMPTEFPQLYRRVVIFLAVFLSTWTTYQKLYPFVYNNVRRCIKTIVWLLLCFTKLTFNVDRATVDCRLLWSSSSSTTTGVASMR